MKRIASAIAGSFCLYPIVCHSQAPAPSTVVVTATRAEASSFDLPTSIDVVSGETIRDARLQANTSEVLNRVPGTVAQGRETYAQEQQVTIRGFGARSQFGVRGIRLLVDGIPASTPDGQGGTGLIDLSSAARIEVLRGPFSALYGNHSGGVIQVFTEDGPAEPALSTGVAAGSYGTWRANAKFGGQWGAVNGIGSVSRLDTNGYRDWSSARKDQANAKLKVKLDEWSSLTVVANYLNQPDNLDPLGLTRQQMDQNRRQANPAALTFRTRRSLDNEQGGIIYERALSAQDSIRFATYIGSRSNAQFLPIDTGPQNNIRHSGGLSAFDRDFWGASGRWMRKQGALTFTAGADYDTSKDARKGYRNDPGGVFGEQGALKRDEDDTATQSGVYAQAEWQPAKEWVLLGGLRYTRVSFESKDKFICTLSLVTAPGTSPGRCSGSPTAISASVFNPDDSGSATYSAWTPAVGVTYHVTPTFNLYANAGRSFETPTFIELAYRPDLNSSGLNFDLRPSTSNHVEAGIKTFVGADTRLNAALFNIRTRDEIVIFSNQGGRASYQNAGRTERNGVELSLDSRFGRSFTGYLAATYLQARFKEAFGTCTGAVCAAPNATVASGNRIPGIPQYSVMGDLRWQAADGRFSAGVEGRWNGRVYVDDVNSERAESWFVTNLYAGFAQKGRGWRLTQFLRVDNVFDREYVGAVYVNDANRRFYAPAPGRSYLVGAQLSLTL